MTTTTITLDESLIGTIVGAPDGYITRFELQTGQWPVYQPDGWNVQPYHGSFAQSLRQRGRDHHAQIIRNDSANGGVGRTGTVQKLYSGETDGRGGRIWPS